MVGIAVAVPLVFLSTDVIRTPAATPTDTLPTPTPVAPGSESPTTVPDPESVKVAFIADAGITEDSREVLRLIRREDTDLVVHSGDFDYEHDPEAWAQMLNEELGPNFPYVATIGNHDRKKWTEYQAVIRERTERAEGLHCTGDLGLQSTCTYEYVTVVQSSVGICDMPEDLEEFPVVCGNYRTYEHEAYVADRLANASMWRICSWHKLNHQYDVGEKGSAVPLSMYDTCRVGGALIATGHQHSYARTHLMSNFTTQTVASRSPPYTIGNGTTFAFISAVVGESFYDTGENADANWWASLHTDGEFGALFCTFRADGTGECYFKTVDGTIVDGPFVINRR